jgi:hypothetical protein
MNARQKFKTLWLALLVTLVATACSDDEPGSSAESEVQVENNSGALGSLAQQDPDAEAPYSGPAVDLPMVYRQECTAGQGSALDCEIMRSLLVVDVAMALEDIVRSRDQRGTAEALSALDLVDEPEILIAACRVLGYFPETPGIAEKVTPLLLDSPYLAVEQAAARLLSSIPDQAIAGMGSQWSSNHGLLYTDEPYALAPDFPEHYFDMGFPEYPDAEWFSPADSDRSVGWWVAGSPAEVSTWLAGDLDVEALSYEQWMQRASAETMLAYQSMMEAPQAVEMQQLTEKYMQTEDLALLEKIQQLQAEMEVVSRKLQEDTDKALNNVLSPPGGVAPEDVHYIVAEEKDGHVSRAILVYRHTGAERTVMQMAWDLRDYPPAWAQAEPVQ